MSPDRNCSISVLIFAASLGQGSLNDRLATLATQVVKRYGGSVDRATMTDFDCPSYDGDVEGEAGIPAPAQEFLISASPSMAGGNRGLWALRVPLEHLGSRVYPDMFSLAQAHEAFGTDGRLANDLLQKRFDETVGCFMDLVEAAKHYPALKKQWVEFLGEKPDAAIDRVETAETAA